ncbi:glycosyl hydrolase-related protein [Niabella aurantiaca]|uniref:glycosyl hydrolase-related protein n=1 Tax=Niabella aurantiaca TaxID=379900 RepID=UPI0012FCF1A4|nr:glycosyl hydrolase-related protein [Niabella aurantiaca]
MNLASFAQFKIIALYQRFFITCFWMMVFSVNCCGQLKELFIADDDHTDFMWTAKETAYDSAMVQMLDYHLQQIDSTRAFPSDFQARFNCDGAYWMRVYERCRDTMHFNRLVAALRSGHISVPLNYLVSTYGAQPTEAVFRGMYPAGRLQQRYKVELPMAIAMENQTLPLGLSSLWAGAGARYSWRGVCACASRLSRAQLRYRQHQLYRYTGPDGRSVIMKWYNTGTRNMLPGGYAEMRGVKKSAHPLKDMAGVVKTLDRMIGRQPDSLGYPYTIAGAFGYGWDNLATYASPYFIKTAKNNTNNIRRVRVSDEVDFFKVIEKKYPHLPHESVSYGNEWDLYSASMQEPTAIVRRALEKLRSAEVLYTLAALQNNAFRPVPDSVQQAAWEAYGKYWEHNWTADGPVSRADRAAWQLSLSRQIAAYSDTLFHLAGNELARQIPAGSGERFYVLNPLSWQRDDVADIEYEGAGPVKVIDVVTGKEARSQRIVKQGRSYLRLLAEQVPPVGFKVFDMVPGNPAPQPVAARFENGVFFNDHYAIRLSPSGAITSFMDKRSGKELVKPFAGHYFNDIGVSDIHDGQPLFAENAGPVSVTLLAQSTDPVAHTIRVTLFTTIDRVTIEDGIQENFGDVKTWAFSLDLDQPETHHEELGAILLVDKKSRGGDYADQNARYDWQTFNHFADLTDLHSGLTLSNLDCSFFKLGNSTPDSLCSGSPQLQALAGGQIDRYRKPYGDSVVMGIYNQNGQKDFRYHFAVKAHSAPFDAANAMKFALEHQNPFITHWVTGGQDMYPLSYSFLEISDPGVLLWGLKPSEEGIKKGVILRTWNLGSRHTNADVLFASPVVGVWQTTHLERNLQRLQASGNKFVAGFEPMQINTYRVHVKTIGGAPSR